MKLAIIVILIALFSGNLDLWPLIANWCAGAMKKLLIILISALLFSGWSCQGQCPQGTVTSLGTCPNPVQGIVIQPANPSVAVGSTISLNALWQLANGTTSNVMTSQCLWASSNAAVASIPSNSPIVTGVGAGSASISCTSGVTSSNPAGIVGSVTVTVSAAPLITNPISSGCASPCPIPNGTNGVAYSFTFAATGGVPPYTWSLSAGSFNSCLSGVSFTSGGVLTGTGTTATCTPTVQVTDSASNSSTLQVSLTIDGSASCGTPPNYCARTDTAVVSGATANGGNPPAALIGLNGAGNCAFDDMNSGPAQANLCRVTDYNSVLANLPASQHYFTTFSSSTQRAWNADSTFFATTDSGGAVDFFSWTAGSPPSSAFVGRALALGGSIEFDTVNPLVMRGAFGVGGNGARSTLNKYTQDGTTGAASWTAGHIATTVEADPINAPGLTAYYSGTLGPFWNPYVAQNTADVATSRGANPVHCQMYRYVQDDGSLVVCFDPTKPAPGIRWLDTKTGQVGGSYGPTGATTGFGPIPAPASPVLTLGTPSGLLPLHSYSVRVTYTVVGNNNSYGGESTPSAIVSVQTLNTCTSGGCSISVTPPTPNPGGGTGINLTETATGFNVYACDNTAVPGCTPTLQANSTNPSGSLARPSISSVTLGGSSCTAGANAHTLYLVARNTGGSSQPSAGFVVNTNSATQISGCAVNFTAVANATNYDVLIDSLTTKTATGTVSPITTTNTFHGYVIQTTPIATTPVISSIVTTTPVPPTVNGAGVLLHNLRIDSSGQWATMTVADAFNITQVGPVKAPFNLDWNISGTALLAANNKLQTCPIISYAAAHWTTHAGILFENTGSPTLSEMASVTFNSDCATMNASAQLYNVANGSLDTQSNGGHLSGSYEAGPIFEDTYVATGTPYSLPTVPYNGEIKGYKLDGTAPFRGCHNWASAQEGFNSTPRGSISQDGKWFVFTSDMQRNANGAQGTSAVGLGSTSGGTSCTLGTSGTCRYDIFVCQIK